MGKKWNKIKLGITAECIMMINLFKDGKKINFMNGNGELKEKSVEKNNFR